MATSKQSSDVVWTRFICTENSGCQCHLTLIYSDCTALKKRLHTFILSFNCFLTYLKSSQLGEKKKKKGETTPSFEKLGAPPFIGLVQWTEHHRIKPNTWHLINLKLNLTTVRFPPKFGNPLFLLIVLENSQKPDVKIKIRSFSLSLSNSLFFFAKPVSKVWWD